MSNIEKPSHYQLEGLEPYESIDVIRAVLGEQGFRYFCHGNTLKYLIRAGKKDGEADIKDYKKSRVYLDWLIESVEENNE